MEETTSQTREELEHAGLSLVLVTRGDFQPADVDPLVTAIQPYDSKSKAMTCEGKSRTSWTRVSREVACESSIELSPERSNPPPLT